MTPQKACECPQCHNPIYDDEALLCLYCGESLDRQGNDPKSVRRKIFFVVIVLIVLVSFVMVMVR